MQRGLFAALLGASLVVVGHGQRDIPAEWTTRTPPFHIIDTIYYVGTLDLASYLVTTRAGHVLIDTGIEQNAGAIMDNIRALGFAPRDVRIMLTTQGHFDHVGAHAHLKKATGARVLVAAGDADLLRHGGKGDYFFGPAFSFPPVTVDGIVRDGEVIRLGGAALTAHLTPGHTKGTTTWTMEAHDKLKRLRYVMFMGSTTVNQGVKLVDNNQYPEIATDYQRSFMTLKALPCDVFLTAHASVFGGPQKASAAAAGKGEDAFMDPAGCRAAIARSQAAFSDELARQREEKARSKKFEVRSSLYEVRSEKRETQKTLYLTSDF
jgi:metallo-beta-lactamase class B